MPRGVFGQGGLVLALLLSAAGPAMAVDLRPLWDFREPEQSELRMRRALAEVSGDDALVLQTQIARSYGLRKQFARAREVLGSIQSAATGAGPEVQIRYAIEWGRSFASAAHDGQALSEEAKQEARQAFERALALAQTAHLDGLAIDAVHMLAFIDTRPEDQLKWAQQALAIALASDQVEARDWEASIRNNIGYALHQLGRLAEALRQFEQALSLREQAIGQRAAALREARWMVAWTLRGLGHIDQALALQLRLQRECDAAQEPDPYVYEELEILYRSKGDAMRAGQFARLRKDLLP